MNNPLSTSKRRSSSSRFLPRPLINSQPKPPSTQLRVEFGAVTHTGKVRPHNEDHFLVSQVSRKQEVLATNVPDDQFPEDVGDDAYSMIVADGMGGMAAGEVASRMAITTGLKLFQKSPKWGFKINKREARELFDRVNGYLQEIDLELTKRSEGDRKLFGMGTTLTAAYSIGVDLFIIHLGDSRAYLYRGGDLIQLTKDHTVAQAMADAGYIAPEEVRHHNKRNVLTNFLGGHGGQGQGRRPLAPPQGCGPPAPLQRRLERHGRRRVDRQDHGRARPARRRGPVSARRRPSTTAAATTSRSSWPAITFPAWRSGQAAKSPRRRTGRGRIDRFARGRPSTQLRRVSVDPLNRTPRIQSRGSISVRR